MSHSKYRAMGQSYYLEANHAMAKRYLRACSLCGQVGFDPIILNGQHNQYLVEEMQHLYKPLPLDGAGFCEICAEQIMNRSAS